MDAHLRLLRSQTQRIRLGSRFFGGAEYAGDAVAALDEGLEGRLAEVLLSNDRNAHFLFSRLKSAPGMRD